MVRGRFPVSYLVKNDSVDVLMTRIIPHFHASLFNTQKFIEIEYFSSNLKKRGTKMQKNNSWIAPATKNPETDD